MLSTGAVIEPVVIDSCDPDYSEFASPLPALLRLVLLAEPSLFSALLAAYLSCPSVVGALISQAADCMLFPIQT